MIYIVRNLFKIFKTKEKLRFILILLLIFFSLILETIGIGMILPIINILIIKERSLGFDLIDNFFVNFSLKKTFFIYLIIFLIFFLIKNIILSITLFLQIKIVYEIKKNYSKILFREFLYKKYKFYTHTNTSFFLNKLGQSINDFTQSLRFVFNSITDTIFVTILICFLLYLKPLITLTIIIFVFIPTQIFVLLRKKKQSKDGKNKNTLEEVNIKNIQQSIGSIKEIKLLKLEEYFFNIFKFNIDNICKYESRQQFFASIPRLIIELCAVILFVAGFFIYSHNYFDKIITLIPSMAVFTAAAFRIMPSLSRILESQQMINFYKPIIENINSEFKNKFITQEFKYKSNNKIKINKLPNYINIKNLSFNHDNGKEIFKNFNAKIKLNKVIGIYGRTGSGKSTLIDILMGFLTPSRGTILLDNKDLFENKKLLNQWQNVLGYVPQINNILDESIEKNIALGINKNKIDKNKIQEVIKICLLEDFIKSKKNGINTILGEKGTSISGGQRQKIAIARALYFEPKILILDESTNALDEKTEVRIIKNLINYKKIRNILLITHKRKLAKYCNTILTIY